MTRVERHLLPLIPELLRFLQRESTGLYSGNRLYASSNPFFQPMMVLRQIGEPHVHPLVRHRLIAGQILLRRMLSQPHSCECWKAIDVAPGRSSQNSPLIRKRHDKNARSSHWKPPVIYGNRLGGSLDPLNDIDSRQVKRARTKVDLNRGATYLEELRRHDCAAPWWAMTSGSGPIWPLAELADKHPIRTEQTRQEWSRLGLMIAGYALIKMPPPNSITNSESGTR